MKKFVSVFFIVAFALTICIVVEPSHAATTTTITVDSSTQQFPSAKVGDTIQVNILINNVQGLWAWDLPDIMFNPAVLNITGITEGPFLKAAGQTMFLWTSSSALAFSQGDIPDTADTLMEYTTASGSGVLATLSFKVLSLGTSQITFSQTTLLSSTNLGSISSPNYQQINCTATDATISVGVTSIPTASPTPSPSSSPTSSPAAASSPTASTTHDAPSSSDPSATPISQKVPEFPVMSILIGVLAVATISAVLAGKKAKFNTK